MRAPKYTVMEFYKGELKSASLIQTAKEDNIIVPRWFLESVEDTLRIQHNINQPDMKKTGETCQDRNIRQSLNGLHKLLKGEELNGMERFEKIVW